MRTFTFRLHLATLTGACFAALIGCSFLKPSGVTPRSFILTPAGVSDVSTPPGGAPPLAVGLGRVTIPNYLFRKAMVMRRESNEIVYLETTLWAERLDIGLQRVLASNLGAILSAGPIRSTWRSDEVSAQIFVDVERFDVDAQGKCVLAAAWRVPSSNGETMLASGKFNQARDVSSPDKDPQAAVNGMSSLVSELSQAIARSLKR